jgi:hypothetical protein
MLYPNDGSRRFSQVEITESDLLYILDTMGGITILNKDLKNREYGKLMYFQPQLVDPLGKV